MKRDKRTAATVLLAALALTATTVGLALSPASDAGTAEMAQSTSAILEDRAA